MQEEKDRQTKEAETLARKRQAVQNYLRNNPFPYELGNEDKVFVSDVLNGALAENPIALTAFQNGAWSTAASKLDTEPGCLLRTFTPHAFEA